MCWMDFNCYGLISSVIVPNNKVHGANMGSTWVLLAPDGRHVGPMNLAIWGIYGSNACTHAPFELSTRNDL